MCFIYLCTGYSGFSQTKIDTVYIRYSSNIAINTTKDSAAYYRVRTISDGVLTAEDYSMKDSVLKCAAYYKTFDPYIRQGHCIFYSNDTLKYSEGDYIEGEMSGIWACYYSTGERWYTETYINGIKNGMLKGYYKTGEVKRIEQYKKGKRVKGRCYTKDGKDTVYYKMHIMPSFPGGDKAMVRYFLDNIIYPEQAKINKIQGTSYISFVVNTDGSIIDVEIVKGKEVHPLLDRAARDCVKKMPTWTPGYLDGSPIKVKKYQRVKFVLPE